MKSGSNSLSRVAPLLLSMLLLGGWVAAMPGVLCAQEIPLNVIERALPNGMRILMVERHDSPTVATYLLFKVGGVDDPEGRSGIAHVLEHMMFKGTRTYGRRIIVYRREE